MAIDEVFVLFGNNMYRVGGLVGVHRSLTTRQGRPPQHASDVLRAAFLMGVATLDAYFADLVGELLPDVLRTTSPPDAIVKLLNDERARRDAILAAPDPTSARLDVLRDVLQRESTYHPKKVSDAMKLIGIDDFWEQVSNLDDDLLNESPGAWKRLEEIADRRNQIAHRNDVPMGAKRAQGIRRTWVEKQIEFMIGLATAAAGLTGHHVSQLTSAPALVQT